MESLIEGNDWRAWVEQFERPEASPAPTPASTRPRGSELEMWDKTDRPLPYPARHRASVPVRARSLSELADSTVFRARWLKKHDVHTRLVDAGIGCCWFAQQGDDEPMCGDTEDAAIARLAAENKLPWHEVSDFSVG
jgi:hypothetical protein